MSTHQLKRGTFARYECRVPGVMVQAIVRNVHRDGSVTVEPRFFLDAAGERSGCYIGGKVRLHADDLTIEDGP